MRLFRNKDNTFALLEMVLFVTAVVIIVVVLRCGLTPAYGSVVGWVVLRGENDRRLYDEAVMVYNKAAAATNVIGFSNAQVMLEEYVSRQAGDARPMAYLLIGECERGRDRHCHSIDSYEWAFARGSNYVKHHAGVNLAYACLRCDRVKRAKEVSDYLMGSTNIRAVDVADRDIVAMAAIVHRRMGHDAFNATDYSGAVIFYRHALTLRPDYVDIACDLARTYIRLAEIANEEEAGKIAEDYVRKALFLLCTPPNAKWKTGRIQKLREQLDSML